LAEQRDFGALENGAADVRDALALDLDAVDRGELALDRACGAAPDLAVIGRIERDADALGILLGQRDRGRAGIDEERTSSPLTVAWT